MESLVSGFLGAVFGGLISLLALRFNYRKLFAETVSANRMEWINVWRENVSKFLACAEVLNRHYECRKPPSKCWFVRLKTEDASKELLRIEIEKEMYEARAMITSRLNLDEPSHRAMLMAITNFDFQTTDRKLFVNQRETILTLERKILKPEWERVKQEAKGKYYGKS